MLEFMGILLCSILLVGSFVGVIWFCGFLSDLNDKMKSHSGRLNDLRDEYYSCVKRKEFEDFKAKFLPANHARKTTKPATRRQ